MWFYIWWANIFVISMDSIFCTGIVFQPLLNSKLGSDQSTHSILSYILGKNIVMRIKIWVWEYPIRTKHLKMSTLVHSSQPSVPWKSDRRVLWTWGTRHGSRSRQWTLIRILSLWVMIVKSLSHEVSFFLPFYSHLFSFSLSWSTIMFYSIYSKRLKIR